MIVTTIVIIVQVIITSDGQERSKELDLGIGE